MMEILIKLNKRLYKYAKHHTLTSTEVDEICDAIANGTPLSKGHGRLIDADAFERRCMFDSDIEDMQDVIYALRDHKSIIRPGKAESEE